MVQKLDSTQPPKELNMPIPKRWSRFTKDNIGRTPDEGGAYEIADRNRNIIYQGGSERSIRVRLASHMRSKRCPGATYFRCSESYWIESGIDKEAKHSEKYQNQYGRKPKYTKRSPRTNDFSLW